MPVLRLADCAAQHRLYRESLECFSPFVLTNGAKKVEAFEKCTAVVDPSPKCGIIPRE